MNGTLSLNANQKPLPMPVDDYDHSSSLPPLPPPQLVHNAFTVIPGSHTTNSNPSQLPNTLDFASIRGLQPPTTPTSPADSGSSSGPPPSPQNPDGKSKKSNPLTDLIDTEKLYVDQLAGVIRRVAAAWSRSNLPPPELDIMFRAIESIYKANRGLLAKLKEIGTKPSSPKALGDLLMRWIDDLAGPYTTYSTRYMCGYDVWEPVASNPRLPTTLALFSSINPPPMSATDHSVSAFWTLDALFLLPHHRLKYYKKLYTRLLKSTSPGKSDYKLLVGALETLDKLLATVDSRSDIKVASASQVVSPTSVVKDDFVADARTLRENSLPLPPPYDPKETSSEGGRGSRHASSSNSSDRRSQDTAPTTDRGSTSTLSSPISELERRLSTARTVDLFTMKPRDVKLQIIPPGLTHTREVRMSVDVVIEFAPKSTGEQFVYQRGHIFLLTDLFLVCERMLPSERAQYGPDGSEMMLVFPPLAGKHLRVFEVPNSDIAISLVVLRKETLILRTPSSEIRRKLLAEFRACIDTAASLQSRPMDSNPPPMPPLNSIPRSSSSPLPSSLPQSANFERSLGSNANLSPPMRAYSPANNRLSDDRQNSPPRRPNSDASNRRWSPSARPGDNTNRLVLSPDAQVQHVAQRVPSLQDPLPGLLSATRTSSTAETILDPMMERRSSAGVPTSTFPAKQGVPFGPGQVLQSYQPGQMMPPSYGPGQIVTSQSYTPGQVMPPLRNTSINHQNSFDPSGPRGPPLLPHGPPSSGPPYGPTGQHLDSSSATPGPYHGAPPRPRHHMQDPGPGIPRQHRSYTSLERPPSEPSFPQNGQPRLRKSQSSFSMNSHRDNSVSFGKPPMPGYHTQRDLARYDSFDPSPVPQPRPLLPSAQMSVNSVSRSGSRSLQESPPPSPVLEATATAPVSSTISAQMKCKIFLKQQHAQWKSLGAARLKLYRESPTNVKQLVVEADNKDKSILISTIVLTDGVERVGKTGVAIELSDKGARTGIVYMIQLRNESSARGLFDSLLAGSDRS